MIPYEGSTAAETARPLSAQGGPDHPDRCPKPVRQYWDGGLNPHLQQRTLDSEPGWCIVGCDLLMWDDLARMHRGAGDAPPQDRRVMPRTIVHPN